MHKSNKYICHVKQQHNFIQYIAIKKHRTKKPNKRKNKSIRIKLYMAFPILFQQILLNGR